MRNPLSVLHAFQTLSVADPGFPRCGGANSRGWDVASTYHFAKFPQKLDEIKRIWTRGRPSRPLRSATGISHASPRFSRIWNVAHDCILSHNSACPRLQTKGEQHVLVNSRKVPSSEKTWSRKLRRQVIFLKCLLPIVQFPLCHSQSSSGYFQKEADIRCDSLLHIFKRKF